jgi:DNA adenine methylase
MSWVEVSAIAKNKLAAPVVKWVGGKRQLLDEIAPRLPKRITTYCEPFLGGGAVLFSLQPRNAIVNDLNADLMLVYEVIRDDVELLIAALEQHENTAEYFYNIRDLDRDKDAYREMSAIERASRIIYLNKTCYNGLFRVNASGEFNSPFGHYKNPNIVNAPVLRAVSKYLTANNIQLLHIDFEEVLQRVPRGGFIYLDPPYDPVSDTASFTGYNRGGFGREEQERLKRCCDELAARGVRFLLSNSATSFIKELYTGYTVEIVHAKRAINSDASKRGAVEEVLIRNYGIE